MKSLYNWITSDRVAGMQLANCIVPDVGEPQSHNSRLFICFGKRPFQMGVFWILESNAYMPVFGVRRGCVCDRLLQWNNLKPYQWIPGVVVISRRPKLDFAKETSVVDS